VSALLPDQITVRQYIALRQKLQQIQLALSFQLSKTATAEDDEMAVDPETHSSNLANISRGECWLWHDGDNAIEQVLVEGATTAQSYDGLWFEKFRSTIPASENEGDVVERTDVAIAVEDAFDKEEYASCIQRWWRRRSRMDIDDDSSAYGSSFDGSMEEEDDEEYCD
jgi:hypothetical protein